MIAVPTIDERLALARRHVDAGHLIIVHQRQMVERHKAEDRDTKAAQELLAVLERTQKVFERDLAELEKSGGEKFSASCRCQARNNLITAAAPGPGGGANQQNGAVLALSGLQIGLMLPPNSVGWSSRCGNGRCPLLAQSGHKVVQRTCPLSG
jgi:hypothetical protein